MAKPQLEDGYTKIANEILDHLARCHFSPNQWQIILFVIRKTYGYGKKVDYIANSQIVNGTGLCKAVVSRVLKDLNEYRLITRNKKHIGFQKDWELWKLAEQSILDTKLAEPLTSEKLAISSTELAEQSTKVSSPRVTQKKKETITKERDKNINIKSDTTTPPAPNSARAGKVEPIPIEKLVFVKAKPDKTIFTGEEAEQQDRRHFKGGRGGFSLLGERINKVGQTLKPKRIDCRRLWVK